MAQFFSLRQTAAAARRLQLNSLEDARDVTATYKEWEAVSLKWGIYWTSKSNWEVGRGEAEMESGRISHLVDSTGNDSDLLKAAGIAHEFACPSRFYPPLTCAVFPFTLGL